MRIVLVFLVFICCLAMSNGTLKLLKAKLKGPPLVYPVAKYKTVKYISAPIVVPEPLPAIYARPAFISTYSVSTPSVATYATPIQVHSTPYAYASTFVEAPVHETAYIEPAWSYGTLAVEGHYSIN